MSWASSSIYGSTSLEKEKACRLNYDDHDDDGDCDDDEGDDNDDDADDDDNANKMS